MYFNGTKRSLLALSCALALSAGAKDAKSFNEGGGLRKPLCFIENKGQVIDQDGNLRNDIQYNVATPGMALYIGNGELHYQFKKVEGTPGTHDAVTTGYRMDVKLLGANPAAKVIATGEQPYYEHYFLPQGGEDGFTVHSWNKITYTNVYPNIDWVFYVRDNKVEYDFVVHPGGNVHDIKMKYGGATALKVTADGSLAAETPLGNITEHSPYAYDATGKTVASSFRLNKDIVTFETGNYTGALTIDPYLLWSTYCGGAGQDVATSIVESPGQNTYIGGYTASNGLATGGAYKTVNSGGGFDAFLAKYNNAGIIQFITYYGGTGNDQGTCVALDNSATNVYLAGFTTSNAGISSGGSYHFTYNGATDGFIVKLNNTGTVRSWATYYGGTGLDVINGIATDVGNNVYITGQTASNTMVSTAGAYQTTRSGTNDAFVAKFNSGGTIQWSTYYGGSLQEQGFGIACDIWSNVIVTGQTNSVSGIATASAYHTTLGGTGDGFIVKFTTGGARTWGTYIGGNLTDQGNAVAISAADSSIVVVGNTTSTSGLASGNGFQQTFGGLQDAFIAYFTPAGANIWTSYYGGTNLDYGQAVCFDTRGAIVVAGGAFSATGISDANAFQPAIGGDYDAYIVKFNTRGQRLWGSYFGGTFYDYANGIACDVTNQLIVAGYTSSLGNYGAGGLSTVGSAQAANGGGTYDAFVTKFRNDTMVFIHNPYTDTLVCQGGVLNVYRDSTSAMAAGNVYTVQLSNAAGSFIAPVNIGSGTTNPIACTIPPATPLGSGYRIRILSSSPAYTSPDNFINIHVVASLPASVASSNSPVCVNSTILLFDTASYTVDSYTWSGPLGFSAATRNTSRGPAVTGYAGIYSVTTVHNGCPASTSTVPVVVNTTIPPTPKVYASDTIVCEGGTIKLFIDPDTTATVTTGWVGPVSFKATGDTVTRTGVIPTHSGLYFAIDTLAGCPSLPGFINITVLPTNVNSISITATPGFTVGSSGDTICLGTMVHFTATPHNGGSAPSYQWMTGPGSPVIGAISNTWESATLTDGETIYCLMNSSATCPSPVQSASNTIRMTVIENAPLVYISASPATHVTPGTPVTFTSTVYNGGIGAVYQWYLNGNPITGATSKTFTIPSVTSADTVSLQVTSTMNCAVPNTGMSNSVVVQTNVGVTNLSAALEHVSLFPNPNSGTFTVKGDIDDISGTVSFEITNLVGQQLYSAQETLQSHELNKTISLGDIPSGIYLLRVSQDGQSKIFRFSLQH